MRIYILAATMALTSSLWSQNIIKCHTDEYQAERELADATIATRRAEAEAAIQSKIASFQKDGAESVLNTIPVVVHIMYATSDDNITDEQVHDALAVLNEDMRKLNADASNVRSIFAGVQADMEVEFKLAKIDPSGNCTNGITRTHTPLSLAANNNVKALNAWPNNKYLNIWVVNFIDRNAPPGSLILGYSAFPYNGIPATEDGIVIRHDQMGRIGTAVSNGRTLTHEVGHWLNLYHTFQSGCNGGDQCADTPPVASASSGCNYNQNTCSNDSPDLVDMIENYMDYSNDVCMNTFTQDQKTRAKAVLGISYMRGNITSAANLVATGVNQTSYTCDPDAEFYFNKTYICEGESMTFYDNSAYAGTATKSWEFINGSNVQTASGDSVTIAFTNPGDYTVKLTINANGKSDTETQQGAFRVWQTNNSYYTNQFAADFETNLPNATWLAEDVDADGVTWETTDYAKQAGLKSVYVHNFNAISGGQDELISAPIVLNNVPSATLKFHYASSRINSNTGDQLRIWVSKDCGETWILRRFLNAAALMTTSNFVTSDFYPKSNEWVQTTVGLNPDITAPYILVKFQFLGGGGNNFFLDNAFIDFGIGIEEQALDFNNNFLVPNPASTTSDVYFSMNNSGNIEFSVIDLQGREVFNSGLKNFEAGDHQYSLPVYQWNAGVYFVRMTGTNGSNTMKLVVE